MALRAPTEPSSVDLSRLGRGMPNNSPEWLTNLRDGPRVRIGVLMGSGICTGWGGELVYN